MDHGSWKDLMDVNKISGSSDHPNFISSGIKLTNFISNFLRFFFCAFNPSVDLVQIVMIQPSETPDFTFEIVLVGLFTNNH